MQNRVSFEGDEGLLGLEGSRCELIKPQVWGAGLLDLCWGKPRLASLGVLVRHGRPKQVRRDSRDGEFIPHLQSGATYYICSRAASLGSIHRFLQSLF